MKYGLITHNIGQGDDPVFVPTAYCCQQINNSQPRSAKDILEGAFGEDFGLILENYIRKEQSTLREIEVFRRTENFRLVSWRYCRTESVIGQPVEDTVVDFIVEATINGEEIKAERAIAKRASIQFRIRYVLDLRPCHKCCLGPLVFPEPLWGDDPVFSQYHITTDEYLVPILYKKDYELAARMMLDKYYPENRREIGYGKIDAEDLAKRMGLTLKDVVFTDSTVMGQIYYDYGIVELYNDEGKVYSERVGPSTILINKAVCTSAAIRNSTIIHECCHAFLDRWFFLLQMMAGKPYAAYTSRTRSGQARKCNTPLDWMELQCDKLPAYILMEGENTKAFIEEHLRKETQPYSIDATRRTINAMSDEYGVSRSMAKYRMIELGFPQAEGIYCFVDGIRIPDHSCSNVWRTGITYTINAAGAARLAVNSRRFATLAANGEYAYINGHFCRNHERYLKKARNGTVFMTGYAKEHMEECCLAFAVSAGGRDEAYRFGMASKNKDEAEDKKYQVVYSLEAEPGTDLYVRENEAFVYGCFEWGDLLNSMPNDFREAVLLILKEKRITQEALALAFGVDRKEIYRLLKSDPTPKRKVVAVCLELKLPYFISERLLELSGNALTNKPEDILYRTFLFQSGRITVDRCNDILKDNKMQPLFNGEKE